jgi:phosphatidate cytidylyltransferase
MLKYRLVSGLIMGAGVIASAIWMPGWGILLILCAVCAVAMLEFFHMLDAAGISHFKYVGLFWGVVLVGTTWVLGVSKGQHAPVVDTFLLPLAVASIFLRQFPQKFNPRPLVTIAGTLLGILYVPLLLNFLTRILLMEPPAAGRVWALYLILVVKIADVGAYTVGCSVGRHRLIPRISPGKTWEGCVGAVGAAVLGSVAYTVLITERVLAVQVGLLHAVGLGALLAVAGILGDLTESLFKRAAGAKDSGVLIAGMGGVLDVIDSLLFAAPALYAYLHFVFGKPI